MPTKVIITGFDGNPADVDRAGHLIVGSGFFDETKYLEVGEPNIAYSFFPPRVGKRFILTGVVAKADKQVSSTVEADVVIYEAMSADATAVEKVLMQFAMVEGDSNNLLGLNIEVSSGTFLNVKTTDDDIHITLIGHYERAEA